jgi:hypothetical protein
MIIVDSCVWIDFFGGRRSSATHLLKEHLQLRDVVIDTLILSETLSGFREEPALEAATRLLERLPLLRHTRKTAVESARIYRRLRKNGITVSGVPDCLIAQVCIENNTPLLTLDKDFTLIAHHSTLKLL